MTPSGIMDIDVYALWHNADELIKETPKGYIRDGEVKHPFWAVEDDPQQVPGCQLALTRFLDGSAVVTRWRKNAFVISPMCPECYRDLGFIQHMTGDVGVWFHAEMHRHEKIRKAIKRLDEIRLRTKEEPIREALDTLYNYMETI